MNNLPMLLVFLVALLPFCFTPYIGVSIIAVIAGYLFLRKVPALDLDKPYAFNPLCDVGRVWRSNNLFLIILTLFLTLVGLISIFDASSVYANKTFGNSYYFVQKQLLWTAIGILAMWAAYALDLSFLRRHAFKFLVVSAVLIVLTRIPGIGASLDGRHRWLNIGGFYIKPSDIFKIVFFVYLADSLCVRKKILNHSVTAVWYSSLMGICILLLLMQHEIFSSVLILSVFVVLMYLAGAHPTAILIPFSFSSFVLLVIAGTRHYVQNGIVDYLNPRSDPFCGGFQVLQSLRAIKNGGVFGTHNPISSHQFIYPPNSHTDFIYSIIVENHGWVGGAVLIFICGVYLFRSFKIAAEAKTVKGDLFFSFLGYGLTFFIGLQMIGHIGIVTGLLPTAGVRLPFVSYNGFSLLSTFFSLGLLMNISSNISRLQKKVRKH